MFNFIVSILTALLFMGIGPSCAQAQTAIWSDFTVTVNDAVYQLPAAFSLFTDNGWTLEADETNAVLEPNQYTSVSLKNDGKKLSVSVINTGIDDQPVGQCLIGGLRQDQYSVDQSARLYIAGFSVGDSRTALLEAWGAPSKTYEGSSRCSLTYQADSYEYVAVGYDPATDKIIDLEIKYMRTPDGYNDAAYAAAVEMPESVTNYAAPEALGDNPLDFSFMLNGVVYQLPVPAAVMAENGWALKGTEYAPKLPAHDSDFGWKLQNGVQALEDVGVFNDSAKANIWANSMVIQYRASGFNPVAIELPGGITLDTKMEELESKWASTEYTKRDGGSFTYY